MAETYSGVVHLLSADGSTVLALDATESVDWSRSVSVTNNTVFSGASISDDVHASLPSVTFSGVISFSKIRDVFTTPDRFLLLINELIDAKDTMVLYGTDDGAIPTLDKCYITSISANRGLSTANALAINLSVQQIDISSSVSASTITVHSVKTNGQLADTQDTGVGSKTELKQDTIDGYVLTQRAIDAGVQ